MWHEIVPTERKLLPEKEQNTRDGYPLLFFGSIGEILPILLPQMSKTKFTTVLHIITPLEQISARLESRLTAMMVYLGNCCWTPPGREHSE